MPPNSHDLNRPKGRNLGPLRALVPFIRPYTGTLLIAMFALLISSGAVLLVPIAVRNVIDLGFSSADAEMVDQYFWYLLGMVLLLGVFGAARQYYVTWLGERVVADLRDAVYKHVIRMDPAFYETTKIGEVLSRLTADTTLIQSISGVGLSIILRSSIQFIGALALLGMTNFRLLGYLAVMLPAVLIPIMIVGRLVRRLSRDSQDRIADASGLATETLTAAQTVQSFTGEVHESRRFGESIQLSFVTAVQRIRARAAFSMVAITGMFAMLIIVMWIGARDVLAGQMTGGELGQFVLYTMFVAMSAAMLSEVWGELQRAAGAMERLVELLEVEPQIKAPENPVALPATRDGRMHFADVSFSYPSRPNILALNKFSLEISPGEKIAFVGPSGAGKTTTFQLLMRFYDPQAGQVLVDGVDITTARPEDVRQRIGIVPQETVIFGTSARENIRFGRPDATDAEVEVAAKAAAADSFIRELPEGYDTYLGERGTRLSGGQKQRIAIARAILKNAPILLLDEATSSLDAESERLVQEALEYLEQDRTTIIIAHRLATVLAADRIVVMSEGRITAIGSHDELIHNDPLYGRLAELQFGESSEFMSVTSRSTKLDPQAETSRQ
ncbi:MAG: ABC transporter transmembrane domain-containing protein [Gammaproteobacteria bacterium]|jgi:ATP-binding cassette subfamily B protein|nr:ABC transporter [Chromatiales bacterium]MCP4926547.1 ATP-binding cassette domain-containing protein [Gammaproteobacteria bacterium]MDP7296177.1 ABC transporter transmembrane domain-containing protein [Gammaproteobacteria bacterium]MDP7418807.1 ABC transporter transmembrane domain-containing protein [Gammaproteobacteria bacterium]MDP7660008.1 ABC transporter transmembrane domain-containing protein [Gammaproteobacteria bacterium]